MNLMYIEALTERQPELLGIRADIEEACRLIVSAYENGGKVLACGNGGSCADADHIVGELMKGFLKKRPLSDDLAARFKTFSGPGIAGKLQTPLRAINLSSHNALSTAFANDIDPEYTYAQLTLGYTDPGDVFIGISTSGNAKNINHAAVTAKALGARLIALTGSDGGKMRESGIYDVLIRVPEDITYRIQESHIAVYHAICLTVEEEFFSE